MAEFRYKGVRISDMFEGAPALVATRLTTGRYLANGSETNGFYQSFHSDTANNSSIQFNLGSPGPSTANYLSGSVRAYPLTTCAVEAYFQVAPSSPFTYPAVTATGSEPTWQNVSIYPTSLVPVTNGSLVVVNNPIYGTPNRAYCILKGGGGGGGGGGRDRGPISGTAGQGGGGGGGQIRGVLFNLTPTAPTINFSIGGGGIGGLSGLYYSEAPASPLSGSSVDGQIGGTGRNTNVNYNGVTYAANAGIGGQGGKGGDNGARGNGGAGGGTTNAVVAGDPDFATRGNDGSPGNAVNVSVKAPGGTSNSFVKQSNAPGAFSLTNDLANLGNGGAGGTSDRDSAGNGQPADSGTQGLLKIFLYYD